MPWSSHGSNADFFRSDNPFLTAYYTFGDAGVSQVSPTGLPAVSGALTDSGPRLVHWEPKNINTASNLEIVQGIVPYRASSGLGLKWNVANPAATDHRYLNIGTNYVTVDNGFFSASRNNSMSGFTVAGWIGTVDA
jgi:hypothetical protein